MEIVDKGSGAPLVLIPGLQGRWEYARPTLDALSRSFRVITFPLCGEPRSDGVFDPSRGLDNFTEQTLTVLDRLGIEQAIMCGISLGGRIALRIAAAHPDRVNGLVLVSTPGPNWGLRARHAFYARLPRLCGPLFLAETPWRLRGEITGASIRAALTARVSVTRMAERAIAVARACATEDCTRVQTRTLVVTGEPGRDRIVPVDGSREYLTLISGARGATIEATGHMGSVTKADVFATLVSDFFVSAERENRSTGNHHAA